MKRSIYLLNTEFRGEMFYEKEVLAIYNWIHHCGGNITINNRLDNYWKQLSE